MLARRAIILGSCSHPQSKRSLASSRLPWCGELHAFPQNPKRRICCICTDKCACMHVYMYVYEFTCRISVLTHSKPWAPVEHCSSTVKSRQGHTPSPYVRWAVQLPLETCSSIAVVVSEASKNKDSPPVCFRYQDQLENAGTKLQPREEHAAGGST